MHTLAKNTHHNIRLIEFCLQKAYPDGGITVERLIADNLVNGTQVAELAISRTSGIPMDSIGYGMDLEDGSDVKTTTVQCKTNKNWLVKNKIRTGKYNLQTQHCAVVTKIVNKIGLLRVISYNPFTDKTHFLLIPKSVHEKLKVIKISFNKITGEIIGIYKQYEVEDWNALCARCEYTIQKYK